MANTTGYGYLLGPAPQFFDANGKPLVGGKLFIYIAGTTTKAVTYSDFFQTENTNPVVLNDLGTCMLIVPSANLYKIVLYDRNGNLLITRDNVSVSPKQQIIYTAANKVESSDSTVDVTATTDTDTGIITYDLSIKGEIDRATESEKGLAGSIEAEKKRAEDAESSLSKSIADKAGTASPLMDGKASVGNSLKYAREDHVHPTDTSRASASHTHGNITNDGKIGSTANLVVVTGTSGAVTTADLTTASPTVPTSGTTTSLEFIDTVGQDSKGKISSTKKAVPVDSTYSSTGTNPVNGKAIAAAIGGLDSNKTSTDGVNVQVKVTETDGKVSAVNVTTDNTENKSNKVSSWQTTPDNTHYPSEKLVKDSLGAKADKVSGAISGNFAGLDSNGNLMDSGSKASDFATSEQGRKADSAIQGVKVNGTTLTPDANKIVNVPLVTTSADGAMSAADKTKLDGIAAGTASPLMDGQASVGKSLKYARENHVHPSDTSREDIANKTTVVLGTSDSKYPTDKAVAEFVNSSISTNTANYISNNGEPFTSVEQLEAYSGPVTNNDYASVTGTDSDGNTYYDRYKATVSGETVTWALEYRLNNSSFTAAQWSAINSGITSALVAKIHTHSNKDVLDGITSDKVNSWDGKEDAFDVLPTTKGGTGTSQTSTSDLASALINSLSTGIDAPEDDDYYVSQYSGGGNTNTSYHRRPVSALWEYIKNKISSVLGLTSSAYSGKAATAGTADKAVADKSGNDIETTYATKTELSTHTHGNIQNGGTLQKNDITIANGDKLVVTDTSDSNKVARASLTFDGATTDQMLSKKGEWSDTIAKARTVVDYGNTSNTIEIGWGGASASTVRHFAVYTDSPNGYTKAIKDFPVQNVRKLINSTSVGSTAVPVFINDNGAPQVCTDDFVHDGDVTSTYSSTGTAPVNGTAVAAAIGGLDVSSVGGDGKYISAISETDGKISATATTMDTTPTAGSTNPITSGGVKTAIDTVDAKGIVINEINGENVICFE